MAITSLLLKFIKKLHGYWNFCIFIYWYLFLDRIYRIFYYFLLFKNDRIALKRNYVAIPIVHWMHEECDNINL